MELPDSVIKLNCANQNCFDETLMLNVKPNGRKKKKTFQAKFVGPLGVNDVDCDDNEDCDDDDDDWNCVNYVCSSSGGDEVSNLSLKTKGMSFGCLLVKCCVPILFEIVL